MNIQNLLDKKLGRKKFFVSAGAAFGGLLLLKNFPFNLFVKNKLKFKDSSQKIKVRINPLAVSRKKIGENNG